MPGVAATYFRTAIRRLTSDRRGVAAVEFALLLPFLLILLIGMSETVTALNTDRKVSQVASSAADLVAQAETISTGEIADIMLAAKQIMLPYSDSSLDVIIASVTFNGDGDPEVDWSRNKSGAAPWSAGAAPPIDIPDAISVAGSSLIVASPPIPTFRCSHRCCKTSFRARNR